MTSNLFDSLTVLKSKLNNIESTFAEASKFETREPIKNRLDEKYSKLVNLQARTINVDIGGCNTLVSLDTIQNSTYKNFLQEELKQYSGSDPIFIDMSVKHFINIIELVRKLNKADEQSMITLLINTNSEILNNEIMNFFPDGESIIDRCNFEYPKKYEEERKKIEEMNLKFHVWGKLFKIKCYKCGVKNTGKHNKIKYEGKQREDELVMQGYYATCKKCDPKGIYKPQDINKI